jgi:hypothetical protein
MEERSRKMKRWLAGVVAVVLAVAFLGGSVLAAEKFVLAKYPDLKIGFTSANLLQALPVSLNNAKVMVDFTYSNGFPWFELRDPSASLTLGECKEIAVYAKARGIEIGYAAQIGLLDAAFWEIMSRAVPNAAVFEGPRTVRSLAFGNEFNLDPKKQAWNLDELYKLVKTANRAGNLAKANGVALSKLFLEGVTAQLPGISGREAKNLLKLAVLRSGGKRALNLEDVLAAVEFSPTQATVTARRIPRSGT